VHDPCAVARVIDPALVECVETFVTVETKGPWTAGMTLVDFDNRYEREPNALVATKLDFDGFWDLVVDALSRIG
jgi:inosine-uridine nucleoside N-ribohydrolase